MTTRYIKKETGGSLAADTPVSVLTEAQADTLVTSCKKTSFLRTSSNVFSFLSSFEKVPNLVVCLLPKKKYIYDTFWKRMDIFIPGIVN